MDNKQGTTEARPDAHQDLLRAVKAQQELMTELVDTLEWFIQGEPADSPKRGVLVARALLAKTKPAMAAIEHGLCAPAPGDAS